MHPVFRDQAVRTDASVPEDCKDTSVKLILMTALIMSVNTGLHVKI